MKFVFLLLSCSLSAQPIYDFLLKGGRVVDPANHRDGQMDIAVNRDKIAKIAPNLLVSHARVVIDVSGYIITPGLIDSNVNLSELKPDYNTLPYGVTTVVDCKKAKIEQAKVRIIAGDCQSPPPLVFRTAGKPDVLSSGMAWSNVLLPRTNLSTVMSIYLNLGMTPEQIFERVTSNAAHAIHKPELGALNEGGVADMAVFEIQQGKFGFVDSARTRLDASRRFRCLLTMRNGAIVWDSDGLSITDTLRAGPYTNFK